MKYKVIKQLLPPVLINIYKDFRNKRLKNINQLSSLPRFTEGKINLFGKDLFYPDAASVASTYTELFENEVYKFYTERENPFIIDLGANIGLSIIYFKQLYPKAKIIALEADPNIFEYLKKNITTYNWDDITLINKAAYHCDTTLQFFSEGADGGRIDNSIKGNVMVEAIDICKIFPENTIVDMLKIDIEGAEVIVLEKCSKNLESVQKLFIEYHSPCNVSPQELSKILNILEQYGFRYDIQHIYSKKTPFFRSNRYDNGFDLQLEIFAWK